jgi:hypothetical protein
MVAGLRSAEYHGSKIAIIKEGNIFLFTAIAKK